MVVCTGTMSIDLLMPSVKDASMPGLEVHGIIIYLPGSKLFKVTSIRAEFVIVVIKTGLLLFVLRCLDSVCQR